ncbi:protein Aeq5-like2 [Nematostella vectensis]|uniref:protein Aeq5-like2 n=1 Tax=Nematostella vectensis TaxID=45351 RepID=UPI0020778C7F|nr:protein Aeq5-like2 [Nematostella vectensis]
MLVNARAIRQSIGIVVAQCRRDLESNRTLDYHTRMRTSLILVAMVMVSVLLPYTYGSSCDSFCTEQANKCLTGCEGFMGCMECTNFAGHCREQCRKRSVKRRKEIRAQFTKEPTEES